MAAAQRRPTGRLLVLANMEHRHLECRAYRHAWTTIGWWRDGGGAKRRLLECERCGSEREDKLRGFTWRVAKYIYAEGYKVRPGSKRPTVAQANQELMSRYPIGIVRPR